MLTKFVSPNKSFSATTEKKSLIKTESFQNIFFPFKEFRILGEDNKKKIINPLLKIPFDTI